MKKKLEVGSLYYDPYNKDVYKIIDMGSVYSSYVQVEWLNSGEIYTYDVLAFDGDILMPTRLGNFLSL